MKIIHLIPSLDFGGTEKVMLLLANEQKKLGLEVKIICFGDSKSYANLREDLEIECIEDVHVQWKYFTTKSKNLNLLYDSIKKYNPDILHSHAYWTDLILYSLPKFQQSKYFSHFHLQYPFYQKSGLKNLGFWFLQQRMTWNYRKCNTRFIVVSEYSKAYYKNFFGRGVRIEKIHNPSPYAITSTANKLEGELLRLISIGRLSEEKNYYFLLQVAQELKALEINFVWHVAGEGVLRKELENEIQSRDLESYIKLVGHQNDIFNLLSESDFLIHGSKKETFGMVFLEAMSTKTPTISLKAGGNEEIIENQVDGVLLPTDITAEDFASEILQLSHNPVKYRFLQENGLRKLKIFSLDNFVEKVMKF